MVKPIRDVVIKTSEPFPGCLLLHMEDAKAVFSALARIQEKWENPAYKDRTDFTIYDIDDDYESKCGIKARDLWQTFNFPSEAIKPFLTGEMCEGHEIEATALKRIQKFQPKYVIAIETGDYVGYKHVVRQAMWHLSPTYRKSCSRFLKEFREKFPEKMRELDDYVTALKIPDDVRECELQVLIQEKPWCTRLKLTNLEMHRYRKAFQRGIRQLNQQLMEDTMDLKGILRLRRRIKAVAIKGTRAKFLREGVNDE